MRFEDKIFSSLKKKKRNEICLKVLTNTKTKYFNLKQPDLRVYIKNKLEFLKSIYLEDLEIREEQLMPFHTVSTNSHYVYGIIDVVDSNNIYIYSNIDNYDSSIKLNLEFIERYSLFSGQVVVLEGKNIGSGEFIVNCIHCIPSVNRNSDDYKGPAKLRIIYKEIVDTDFDNVDVIILIDVDLHKHKDQLENFARADKSNRIIIVPILGDDVSINVFPQVSDQSINPLFTFLSNPGEIVLNGRYISFNMLDILSDLKKEEISFNKIDSIASSTKKKHDPCGELLFKTDAIDRLCYHAIFQMSYLPTFSTHKNVQYDFNSLAMRVCPDIYVLKSEFNAFMRTVGPTKIINIGCNRTTDFEL